MHGKQAGLGRQPVRQWRPPARNRRRGAGSAQTPWRNAGNRARGRLAAAATKPRPASVQRHIKEKDERNFDWWAEKIGMSDDDLYAVVAPRQDDIEEVTKEKTSEVYKELNNRIFEALNVKQITTEGKEIEVGGTAHM